MEETIIKVPSELFAAAESLSFAGTYAPDCIEAGPDVYTFATPLAWNVLVSNTGGAFLVAGTVEGEGTTECARCLEPVKVAIRGDVEGYFVLADEEGLYPEDEDQEFDVLGPENTIDLAPLLEAAVIVDVPLQPLCREDCAGICPDCGANLNTESCDCAEKRAAANAEFEAAKNPFAKLRELDLGALSQ